jgi:flagellar biosynthetic protein FliR
MLAAPIVLAALVGNVGLAVMNRAAPAVNVFSIAFACVLILGGVVLLATATSLIGGMAEISREAIAVMVG